MFSRLPARVETHVGELWGEMSGILPWRGNQVSFFVVSGVFVATQRVPC